MLASLSGIIHIARLIQETFAENNANTIKREIRFQKC